MKKIISVLDEQLPHYDRLYIISDLHLGGPQHFQIFNAGQKLKDLIEFVQALSATQKTALVINGDLVDFLAERPAVYFDPEQSVDKLERITGDPSFSMIWTALQNFVAAPGTSLVIILGNHDVELALPWVRSRLIAILSKEDPLLAGKIMLSFEGQGFSCKVGKATVLCVHGNEVDEWNVTDHETIRRIGRDIIQGKPVDDWIPNAGTQLVIDIMNNLKSRFAFIDLLKPEIAGVIPIILALDPSQKNKVLALMNVLSRKIFDKIRLATGFLGEVNETMAADTHLQNELPGYIAGSRNVDRGRLQAATSIYADRMLDEMQDHYLNKTDPVSLIDPELRSQTLGLFSAVTKFIQGADKNEVLREALEKLQKDRSFITDAEDETFTRLDELVGDHVNFIVAGHTHLEKALPRKHASGYYFNSGTWVRLIKLEDDVLKDKDKFSRIIEAFKIGKMETLDAFNEPVPLVKQVLTVVEIRKDEDKTTATLKHVNPAPSPELFLAGHEIWFTY